MDAAKSGWPNRQSMMPITLLLILGTETAFFTTLVMTYLFMRGGGTSMTFRHPALLDISIAGLNTLVLLGSAVAVHKAERAIVQDRVGSMKMGLLIGLGLGAIFIAGQIFEFRHAGMSLRDFSFGGAFFALIGFHATHVLAGVVILTLNLARAQAGDFTARRHVAVTAGAWFWYFVVAVWIVLFIVLYLV